MSLLYFIHVTFRSFICILQDLSIRSLNGTLGSGTENFGFNKDEMNYFAATMGFEVFKMWADNRKSEKIAELPEEDLERVNSFLNDAPGEQWERDSALISQLWFNAAHFRMAEEQAAGGGKFHSTLSRKSFVRDSFGLRITSCGVPSSTM